MSYYTKHTFNTIPSSIHTIFLQSHEDHNTNFANRKNYTHTHTHIISKGARKRYADDDVVRSLIDGASK